MDSKELQELIVRVLNNSPHFNELGIKAVDASCGDVPVILLTGFGLQYGLTMDKREFVEDEEVVLLTKRKYPVIRNRLGDDTDPNIRYTEEEVF